MAGLRAAELEVLYTANTTGVDKGEQKVKESADRIESKPVVQKVDADVSAALAGMDRVEAAVGDFDAALLQAADASKNMSTSLVRNFLVSDRATKKSASEIEGVLVRSYGVAADAARRLALISKGEFKQLAAAAAQTDATVKVDVESSEALAGMDRVEKAARKLVSERAVLQLDADITRTDKALERARAKVEDLAIRAEGGFEVSADVKRAEASLSRLEQQAERLKGLRASVDVDASTAKAEAELDQLADKVEDATSAAGERGGASFGRSLDGATRGIGERVGDVVGGGVEDSLISALTAIPVAGGIILAGVAIGKAVSGAVQDGLQQEVGFDRLEALTGISPAAALRIGRAAGAAYANVFGDSVEANMDTARLAMQFQLLDGDSSNVEARKTIEGLAGIADIMREDVQPVAQATATLLSTGVASSAKQAFDLIAAGERQGLNRAGDLLDTLTEYPALFARLGLSGPQSLGLMSQALQGGARNADLAADALKEFQIRATDASKTSAEGFELLGLNAADMTAKIARGGPDAAAGLGEVLEKLRQMEDPVQRNAAAVALFGTQAEDLGDALFRMDLSTAVDQIGQVEGAAQRMFDTIADNDATRIAQAERNIEVAVDGIKGTLAAGFAEPLSQVAEFVSANRGPVTQFFLDLVNGAFDWGETMVNSAADGAIAFGEFVAGPGADMVDMLITLQRAIAPLSDTSELEGLRDGMREFDDSAKASADTIRGELLDGLEVARGKVNEFGEGAVAMGFLNDASLRLADAVSTVGYASDGVKLSLEGLDLAHLSATDSGAQLERQLRGSIGALQEELNAAVRAGEGQEELTSRYDTTTQALIDQLTQMGLTREHAEQLVRSYASLPQMITTAVTANTAAAENSINQLITTYNGSTVRLNVATDSLDPTSIRRGFHGGIVQPMARGGIPDLVPMSATAVIVPADTWRVVGDRFDVPEAFVPMDNSPRSLAIQRELNARQPAGAPADVRVSVPITITGNPDAETIALIQRAVEVAVRDAMPSQQF
ncbi:MAG: phage tail tape measure protein [Microbacterium enclense]